MTFSCYRFSTLFSVLAFSLACNARLGVEGPPIDNADDEGAGGTDSDSPSCSDQLKNGNEDGVDCGGSCPACSTEPVCTSPNDCEGGACVQGVCQAPSCSDNLRNGDEEGVDCGGTCLMNNENAVCFQALVPCDCASSAALTGLACGPSRRPDIRVYMTPNGQTALFFLAEAGAFRWDGAASQKLSDTDVPQGISDDGSVMLFQADNSSYLLNPQGTRTELPFSAVSTLSEDGTVVLGSGLNAENPYLVAAHSYRWTAGGALAVSDGDPDFTHAASFMTPDGSLVGGRRSDQNYASELFLWSPPETVRALASLPEWVAAAKNDGVVISRNGAVIAGFISTSQTSVEPNEMNQIFRWTEAGGLNVVAQLWPSGATGDYTTDSRLWLNDDGSALVGTFDLDASTVSPQPSAFRWTEATGPVALAATPGQESIVLDASGNLGVIVGYTRADNRPFVWTEASSLQDLGAVLTSAAVDQTGWELGKAVAVSRDGRVVVGEGTCNGVPALYRAVLP